MATQYTSLLGLALPVTGELSGSWGDTVNTAITSLLDNAVAGTTSITTDADTTLTTTTGVANQARQAIILWNPASGTVTRNITAPAQSKIYTVINASGGTQSIVFRGAGPTTGVTIVKGESAVVAWNGTDFIKVSNTGGSASFTNVTVTGTTTLSGLTASTALALDASKNVVSVTNTGTGNNVLSASPTLTGTVAGASLSLSSLTATRVPFAGVAGLLSDSANMTFNGTRLTVADLADSGLTSGRVTYASSGGALVDSANLTFDGTNLQIGNTSALSAASGRTDLTINGSSIGAIISFGNAGVRRGYIWQDGTDLYLANQPNGSAIFITNNAEQMRLTSTGLGIGTSSPGYKLEVNGGASDAMVLFNSTNVNGAHLRFASSGTLTSFIGGAPGFLSSGTANDLGIRAVGSVLFATNGSGVDMTLDSSGNLGLGVTPSAWSLVKAIQFAGNGMIGSYNNQVYVASNWVFDGADKYIASGFAARYYTDNGAHRWQTAPSGTAGNAITFTQAMTLDASGNLGIGTSSPSNAKLVVSGTSAGTVGAIMSVDTASTTSFLRMVADLGSQNLINWQDGTALRFATSTQAYGTFNERMRLDSSGNLGLGVTPSAWSGYGGVLELKGTGFVGSATANMQVGANFFFNGSNAIYKTSAAASFYQQNSGTHLWYTAPSGTAGNAISFTQAMTLDASGRLMVGSTSNSYIFSVQQNNTQMWTDCQSTYVEQSLVGSSGTNIDWYQSTKGTGAIIWRQNGTTERARIDSSGNLLVGATATSAGARLYVVGSGSSNAAARFYNPNLTDSNFTLYVDKPSTTTTTSQVFIGFTVNAQTAGSGQINANGASQAAFGSFSDARLKENIVDLTPQLSNLMALRPVEFDYKDGSGHQTGFVAQEMQQVYPDAIGEQNGFLTVSGYGKTEARLIKAIQEQQAIIESLKARLDAANL